VPRNSIGKAPFPPVVLFDEDRNLSLADLLRIARRRPTGVTICVRYPDGPPNRGGYFFHFVATSQELTKFNIFNFENRFVKELSAQELVCFINHCTGRQFDENAFILCQTELNFLKDEEPNA
jgi:hypothetical protein